VSQSVGSAPLDHFQKKAVAVARVDRALARAHDISDERARKLVRDIDLREERFR
jgi:hypothetical protein